MATNVKVVAILLGAGSSTRMNGGDKIMMPLLGRPLLLHSLVRLGQAADVDSVVIVAAEHNESTIRRMVDAQREGNVTMVCIGGSRRQDSVRRGLQHVGDATHVLVHDGARPLIDQALIERAVGAVKKHRAAIAAVPVKDTIKRAGDGMIVGETVPREGLWSVQTPQIFEADLLKLAHRRIQEDVTDDASMIERLGHSVKIFMGSYENIKVTTAEDVVIAEALLRSQSRANAS